MYTHTSICRIYQIYNTDSENQLHIYPNLWYNYATAAAKSNMCFRFLLREATLYNNNWGCIAQQWKKDTAHDVVDRQHLRLMLSGLGLVWAQAKDRCQWGWN